MDSSTLALSPRTPLNTTATTTAYPIPSPTTHPSPLTGQMRNIYDHTLSTRRLAPSTTFPSRNTPRQTKAPSRHPPSLSSFFLPHTPPTPCHHTTRHIANLPSTNLPISCPDILPAPLVHLPTSPPYPSILSSPVPSTNYGIPRTILLPPTPGAPSLTSLLSPLRLLYPPIPSPGHLSAFSTLPAPIPALSPARHAPPPSPKQPSRPPHQHSTPRSHFLY